MAEVRSEQQVVVPQSNCQEVGVEKETQKEKLAATGEMKKAPPGAESRRPLTRHATPRHESQGESLRSRRELAVTITVLGKLLKPAVTP